MENRKKYWLLFMPQKFHYRDMTYMMLKPVKLQNSIGINMILIRTAKETEMKIFFFSMEISF